MVSAISLPGGLSCHVRPFLSTSSIVVVFCLLYTFHLLFQTEQATEVLLYGDCFTFVVSVKCKTAYFSAFQYFRACVSYLASDPCAFLFKSTHSSLYVAFFTPTLFFSHTLLTARHCYIYNYYTITFFHQ